MKKPAKILLAIATVWPFVWFVIFFASIFGLMMWGGQIEKAPKHATGMPLPFLLFFGAHFLTILWIFGLTAVYVIYLFKTDRVPQDKKALWAVALFMGNVLAFPVFWYFYIWKEPPSATIALGA